MNEKKQYLKSLFIEKYFLMIQNANENSTNSFVYINEKLSTHANKIAEIIEKNCNKGD
tara:strand:+ start:17 stop:190 length:174 start_codon:yes stop_codon:yes gene_type:complete